MYAEENKAIFLQFIKELGKGNLDIVDEVCSPDFAFHSPNFPDWPRGLEGARKLAGLVVAQSSDVKTKLEDIFAADDKVVLRMIYRGTYAGEDKPGYPKPGDRFVEGGVAIYRFVNGKIVDDWGIGAFCRKIRTLGIECESEISLTTGPSPMSPPCRGTQWIRTAIRDSQSFQKSLNRSAASSV